MSRNALRIFLLPILFLKMLVTTQVGFSAEADENSEVVMTDSDLMQEITQKYQAQDTIIKTSFAILKALEAEDLKSLGAKAEVVDDIRDAAKKLLHLLEKMEERKSFLVHDSFMRNTKISEHLGRLSQSDQNFFKGVPPNTSAAIKNSALQSMIKENYESVSKTIADRKAIVQNHNISVFKFIQDHIFQMLDEKRLKPVLVEFLSQFRAAIFSGNIDEKAKEMLCQLSQLFERKEWRKVEIKYTEMFQRAQLNDFNSGKCSEFISFSASFERFCKKARDELCSHNNLLEEKSFLKLLFSALIHIFSHESQIHIFKFKFEEALREEREFAFKFKNMNSELDKKLEALLSEMKSLQNTQIEDQEKKKLKFRYSASLPRGFGIANLPPLPPLKDAFPIAPTVASSVSKVRKSSIARLLTITPSSLEKYREEHSSSYSSSPSISRKFSELSTASTDSQSLESPSIVANSFIPTSPALASLSEEGLLLPPPPDPTTAHKLFDTSKSNQVITPLFLSQARDARKPPALPPRSFGIAPPPPPPPPPRPNDVVSILAPPVEPHVPPAPFPKGESEEEDGYTSEELSPPPPPPPRERVVKEETDAEGKKTSFKPPLPVHPQSLVAFSSNTQKEPVRTPPIQLPKEPAFADKLAKFEVFFQNQGGFKRQLSQDEKKRGK